MLVSSMLVSYMPINIGFSRLFEKIIHILGICKTHLPIIILGNISGFVTGAKLLNELPFSKDDKNACTKSLILSSNAGLGFVISFVGIILWDNIQFGIFIYLLQLAVSIFLNCFIFFRSKSKADIHINSIKRNPSLLSSFTNSVSSSTNTIITVCSYTVVFSLLSNIIVRFAHIPEHSFFSTVLFSLLDITQGLNDSILLENTLLSAFFTGFSVGFGGISVAFQIFSTSYNLEINKKMYFISKLLQGILCGIFACLYVSILKIEPSENAQSTFALLSAFNIEFGIFFVIICIISLKNKIKSVLL